MMEVERLGSCLAVRCTPPRETVRCCAQASTVLLDAPCETFACMAQDLAHHFANQSISQSVRASCKPLELRVHVGFGGELHPSNSTPNQ